VAFAGAWTFAFTRMALRSTTFSALSLLESMKGDDRD
jgi:hypothetical protein